MKEAGRGEIMIERTVIVERIVIAVLTMAFVMAAENVIDRAALKARVNEQPGIAESAAVEAELARAGIQRLERENRRIAAENARLRGVIHECLWMSRGINYPNKPETLVQQHLDFQALLAGALE
jgi:hypothetical protein